MFHDATQTNALDNGVGVGPICIDFDNTHNDRNARDVTHSKNRIRMNTKG